MPSGSIASWLADIGLRQYTEQFEQHDITPDLLAQLTDESLKEIGVRALGHRLRILASISREQHGTSLRHIESDAERRQLTVMFCDLVGSTALSGRLDPEQLREVLRSYHDMCTRTIARFDGEVAQYLGDGLLVYFGYPVAHEDDAQRALRAGLDILSQLGELNQRLDLQPALSIRVGVHTGLVVVGETGSGPRRQPLALGETPNLAALAQSLAQPDTLVVTAATQRLTQGVFHFEDVGEHQIKNLAVPLHLYKVLDETAARSRLEAVASVGLTPLVGRVQELNLLLDRWAQAREGQGGMVLISGDAGIGKSRLLHAMLDRLAGDSHLRMEFRCWAYYANSPFHPVIDALPELLGWTREDSDDAKWGKLAGFCERYRTRAEAVAVLGALLSVPPNQRSPLPAMSPERQKQLTLQALVSLVLSVCCDTPLLLIAEDLHWADPTTLELLTLLLNQVAVQPVLVVLTARLAFQPPWPAHAHATALVLGRLSRQQARQFVHACFGTRTVPKSVADEVVDKTDGVPLFLEELTRMVLESGMLEETDQAFAQTQTLPPLAIPATLQDSLMARLDRLTTAKPVAQLAATLGRAFSASLLHSVSTLEPAAVEAELTRLVDADMLHERGVGAEVEYVFKHALIQEAAYQSLLKTTRQQYHGRIAQVLVEQFQNEANLHPELVAAHYTGARQLGEALQWWQRAGQHAMQRAAYREAINHYRKGLEVLQSWEVSPHRDQTELAMQVELGYALIPVAGWAAVDTERAFKRAGELSKAIGDTPRLFRALWGLGAFYFVRGDQRLARDVAKQCLEAATRAQEPDALIEAYYLRGIVSVVHGDFQAGRRDLDQCVSLYGDVPRPLHAVLYGQDPKASAFGWLGMTMWTLGHPDQGLARAYDALAFVKDAGNPFLLARALAGIGFVHVFRGEPQPSPSQLESAVSICSEQGFVYFKTVVAAFQGINLVHLDRAAEGIELIEQSVAALRAMGSELLFTLIFAHLARAYLQEGKFEEARTALDEGHKCIEKNGERWGEAELYRIEGELNLVRTPSQPEAARALFEKALALACIQEAKAYELRAAMSLVKLHRENKDDQAWDRLRTVRGWFGEGFETSDLKEAAALLM